MAVVLFGLLLITTAAATTKSDLVINQLSYCSASIGGKLLNLRPLGNKKKPRLSAQYGEGHRQWSYAYSPCQEFSMPDDPDAGFGDKCLAVSVCKFGERGRRKYFYTLGFQQNAKFIVNNDSKNNTEVKLVFGAYRSMKGKTTYINLVCDRNRSKLEDALFTIISDEKGLGNVEAELHHLCCCLDGCPETENNNHGNQGQTYNGANNKSGNQGQTYYGAINNSNRDFINDTETVFVAEQKDTKTETDRTKVMIIVGVNMGIILMAGAVGLMCYNKRSHLEIYHKLPGRSPPEQTLWQLTSSTDLEMGNNSGPISSASHKTRMGSMSAGTSSNDGYRDGAPNSRRKSLCFPILEHCTLPEELLTMGQRLGGGIFGDTYIGEWTGITVSIKRITLSVHKYQINQENINRLQEQVAFLSVQRHRNIVSVLGFCSESKHPYVISEFITGQVVKDFIKLAGIQLTWPHRVKILSQMADGMAFLHSTNPPILHRDLRCANMFITNNDVIKVCDFGIVKLIQPLRASCQVEDCCCQGHYSACPQSIAWTAPEVLQHPNSLETDEHITTAADVYSFAVVMWELIMCDDPFEDISTAQEVMQHVMSGGRPEIPAGTVILPAYVELMNKCWDADATERYCFKQVTVQLKEILYQAKSFQKVLNNSRGARPKTVSKSISFAEDTKL